MLQADVIGFKPLRSIAGKARNVATVIYMWRPFLSQSWAALASADEPVSSKSAHCVWLLQIEGSLAWLLAFLDSQQGTILRVLTFNSYSGVTAPLEITTDASVWGIRGWNDVAGNLVACLSSFAHSARPGRKVEWHREGHNHCCFRCGFESFNGVKQRVVAFTVVMGPISLMQSGLISVDQVGCLHAFGSPNSDVSGLKSPSGGGL